MSAGNNLIIYRMKSIDLLRPSLAYSEPCQTSQMKRFAKIVDGLKAVYYFRITLQVLQNGLNKFGGKFFSSIWTVIEGVTHMLISETLYTIWYHHLHDFKNAKTPMEECYF